MKNVSLLTASLIALGVVSQALAGDPVVYLTGSTAFRGTVFNAITSGKVMGTPDFQATYGNGTASKANYMIFHGTVGGNGVWLDCSWNGSDAGLGSVLGLTIDNDGAPLFGSPVTWAGTNNVAGNFSANPANYESDHHAGDIAFADTSVEGALSVIQAQNDTTPMTDYGRVGVVTFTWAKNNNNASASNAAKTAWNNLTNITTYQEQNLFPAGALTADYFTGSAADSGTYVYLVGRNKGSGTRANALLNAGFTPDSAVVQFNIGGGLTGAVAVNQDATKLDINGGSVSSDEGVDQNDGYESGGNVAKALGAANSTGVTDPFTGGTGYIAVGYLGVGDALGIGGQADQTSNWLTENGIKESSASITSGEYSYWGYEHLYGAPGLGNNTLKNNTANALLSGTQTQIGTAGNGGATEYVGGINLNYMNAYKAHDYSIPTHN